MNAKQCVDLAREHYEAKNNGLALGWLVDAVVKLADAEQAKTHDAPPEPSTKMTAEDAAVYAEAVKTITLLRAKYGLVAP